MKILITGATGFVGQDLVPKLVAKFPGSNFITINRDVDKARALFPDHQIGHISINDLSEIEQFNPDVVIHLATYTTSRSDLEVIDLMLNANINFGVKLLEHLTKCNALKLFVNTGSFSEYMLGGPNYKDAYLYSATKTAFRTFIEYYSDLVGFKYLNVIPFTVYGGNATVKRIMDYIVESFYCKQAVEMTPGEQVLDFIHISDLSNFYVHILTHLDLVLNQSNGVDYYVGSGQGLSLKQLVGLMERASSLTCNIKWGGRPYRERDIMYAVADIERAKKLGWEPLTSIEDGVKQYLCDLKICR